MTLVAWGPVVMAWRLEIVLCLLDRLLDGDVVRRALVCVVAVGIWGNADFRTIAVLTLPAIDQHKMIHIIHR